MYTKGAPEIILNTCKYYLTKEGKKEIITEEIKKEMEEFQIKCATNEQKTPLNFGYNAYFALLGKKTVAILCEKLYNVS